MSAASHPIETPPAMPPELVPVLRDWTSNEAHWYHRVYCVVEHGRAHWTATDGHRLLRVEHAETEIPSGAYVMRLDAAVLEPLDGDPPQGTRPGDLATYAKQGATKGPWSFNPAYFGALGAVEKALAKADFRLETMTLGLLTAEARKALKTRAAGRACFAFELGGPLDPMVARLSIAGVAVTALIMPRASCPQEP